MKKTLAAAGVALIASAGMASAADLSACLITKTDTNPFFVKMKEGATAKANELGIELKTFAGKIDGDHETQVQAIETCILDGAKGILLTASDTSSIVPAVKQARDAGLLVIALDTPLNPIDAADATFATDNFLAGELIGKWAASALGDKAATAKIGMLDLAVSQPTVGVLRDQGFLKGFGRSLSIRLFAIFLVLSGLFVWGSLTALRWPSNTRSTRPLSTSQTRTVLSSPAEATRLPSLRKATP